MSGERDHKPVNAGNPVGMTVQLTPELVFEETMKGNEHRYYVAMPYVSTGIIRRRRGTCAIHIEEIQT